MKTSPGVFGIVDAGFQQGQQIALGHGRRQRDWKHDLMRVPSEVAEEIFNSQYVEAGNFVKMATAIVQCKIRVIDLDLRAYFDTVRHHLLLEKVARRIKDDDVMRLLKRMLTASGKQGVPQGGVISPLLSNIYLNEVDRMLERAKDATRNGKYTYVEYARFADDLVVLIDAHPRHAWLLGAVTRRLREEFAKLQVEVNEEKSRTVNLDRSESFGFLGFDFRRLRT